MKKVKLHLGYAGHCLADEHHAIQGGRKQKVAFHALWGVIEHPEEGYILYDTGYSRRFFDATRSYPNRIYAKMTKVVCTEADEVIHQLKENGIQPEEVRHIIITHFHADHVGGIKDFPNARFYASRAALKQALEVSNFMAFTKGLLKGLHPSDLKDRTSVIEDICQAQDDELLGTRFDLFGDQSIFLVPLPGHAAGQLGVLLETETRPYFLIADACWLKKSYQEMVLPNPIVKLFFHSWSDFKSSLQKVHDYHLAHPETVIVPTHCAETTDPLISSTIDFHAL